MREECIRKAARDGFQILSQSSSVTDIVSKIFCSAGGRRQLLAVGTEVLVFRRSV